MRIFAVGVVGLTASLLLSSSVFAAPVPKPAKTTDVVVNEPTGTTVGDVLVATMVIEDGPATTITPPAGWQLALRTSQENNLSVASYWKVAGNAEPSNYIWTIGDKSVHAIGGIAHYSGIDTVNPIDTSAGTVGKGITAAAPSVTTTSAGEKVVAIFATDKKGYQNGFATTSGMRSVYVANASGGPLLFAEDMTEAVAGPTGSVSSTFAKKHVHEWVAQTIALKPAASVSTLGNGLVAYWPFEGNSTDAVSNLNGTDSGVTYSTGNGIVGQGAGMSVAQNSVITLPDSSVLKQTGPFTINVWMKTTTNTGGGLLQVFSSNPNVSGYILSFGNPQIHFDVGNNSGTTEGVNFRDLWNSSTPTSVIDGNWHMITAVYDGSNMSVYLDGNSTPDVSSSWSGIGYDSTVYARIGTYNASGSELDHWNGSEDELGLWSRALSSSEISELYNGGAGKQPF